MKKVLILLSAIILISCDNTPVKSQQEILTEQTRETVLKAFNAQMDGEIDLMKSLLADNFTFILTGQLDVSKTYSWDEFLEFAGYFGSLLKGDVGVEYMSIIVDGRTAMVFAEGRQYDWSIEGNNLFLIQNIDGKEEVAGFAIANLHKYILDKKWLK